MIGPAFALMFVTVAANVLRTEAQHLPLEIICEEQKLFNLTCDIRQSSQKLAVWKKDSKEIAVCSSTACSPDNGYSASISNGSSILTILNPTRQSEATYSCEALSPFITINYNLKVYARPESVMCGHKMEENTVKIACNVSKAYPNSFCSFTWIVNNTETTVTGIPYETKSTQEGDYFNTVCTLTLPAKNFSLGSHKFKVLAYPNVTGRYSDTVYGVDSSQTDELIVNYPIIRVDLCPGSYVPAGKLFVCTCRETANTFILANTSLSDAASKPCSDLGNTTCVFTARRNMILTCQAELPNGIHSSIKYRPPIIIDPTVTSFKVNDKSENLTVARNSVVNFSCEADGDPRPSLSIRKDNVQLAEVSNITQTSALVLKTNKTMQNCQDSGVYVCLAQADKTASSRTISIFIKCATELENPASQNKIYQAHVNDTIDIVIPVLGYPQPTDLHLTGVKAKLQNEAYSLTYVSQTPPYGHVLIIFYTAKTSVFQNYTLYINNSEGSLLYNFQVAEASLDVPGSQKETELNFGAIVGSFFAGILVTVMIVIVFCILWKKGFLQTSANKRNTDSTTINYEVTYTVDRKTNSQDKVAVPPYENVVPSDDLPVEETTPTSHYEELIENTDDLDGCVNKDSETQDKTVVYENSVSDVYR